LDWVPDWVLKATRLGIDNEEETGTAQGALLSFKGVPLLPIPYLSFPLSDKRKSGYLPPTVGLDNVNGTEFAQPYYWDIAPNRDATPDADADDQTWCQPGWRVPLSGARLCRVFARRLDAPGFFA
jgi:lipopolysaccharide assembly outer membrane protein LptD (OstA)